MIEIETKTRTDEEVLGAVAESVGTPAALPEQEKVRPWEKMPRKVWELLEDMNDDPDTRTEMTMAAVRYLFTGIVNPDFKGTKRLVYKSICLDIDMYKDITKKRESAGRKGGKFHKRKAKTDLVKQNDDLLENAEAKEEDALARKEIRGKSKEVRDKNGTNVPIDTNVSETSPTLCEKKKTQTDTAFEKLFMYYEGACPNLAESKMKQPSSMKHFECMKELAGSIEKMWEILRAMDNDKNVPRKNNSVTRTFESWAKARQKNGTL